VRGDLWCRFIVTAFVVGNSSREVGRAKAPPTPARTTHAR
jgi:hypothetical protein